jgi:hypothetical protein
MNVDSIGKGSVSGNTARTANGKEDQPSSHEGQTETRDKRSSKTHADEPYHR